MIETSFSTKLTKGDGGDSSEGFEKNACTSQYEYHIGNGNNSLILAGKIQVLRQIFKIF